MEATQGMEIPEDVFQSQGVIPENIEGNFGGNFNPSRVDFCLSTKWLHPFLNH
jgi:hypothetical protein